MADCLSPRGSDTKLPSCATTAGRRRFGRAGRDQPLRLEALEGRIDRAHRVIAIGARGNIPAYAESVGVVAKTSDGKENRELEGSEGL